MIPEVGFKRGADLLLVINASPYHIGKIYEREKTS
jgi:hypothetical protein